MNDQSPNAREQIESALRRMVLTQPEAARVLHSNPKEVVSALVREMMGDQIDEKWLEDLDVQVHMENGRTMHLVVPDTRRNAKEPFSTEELMEAANVDLMERVQARRDPGLNSFLRTFNPTHQEAELLNRNIGHVFGSNGGCPICGFTTSL